MKLDEISPTPQPTPNVWALVPLGIFLILYLFVSILAGDFYKMPITIAFVVTSVVSIILSKGGSLNNRIELFCRGAANSNIILMVLIYIMAGAFAQTAKSMGAVDATVNLALATLPSQFLIAGIFVTACFISLSIGSSVGTIVALAPVAVGIATRTTMPIGLMLGVVVSGAMFGDNLSFISDTTIVATKTQGCAMSDKFKHNIYIALPIALICILLYFFVGKQASTNFTIDAIEWIKVAPYVFVLLLALSGVNVLVVLLLGILFSGFTGLYTDSFGIWDWLSASNEGMGSMGELIIVTLLAGGVLEMIRYNGGIAWIIQRLTSNIHSRKGAEASIAAFVSLANVCTANNTIALIMSGSIARNIALQYHIAPRRTAALMDISSCFVQGIIPYGAQLLMASGLAHVSPIEIMRYLYYPYLLGLATIIAILTNYPRIIDKQNIKYD